MLVPKGLIKLKDAFQGEFLVCILLRFLQKKEDNPGVDPESGKRGGTLLKKS